MRYYPVFDNLFDDFFTTDSQGTSSVIKKVVSFVKNVLADLILVHFMSEMMFVQKMLKPLSIMENWLSQFLKKHQRKLKKTNLFLLNSR